MVWGKISKPCNIHVGTTGNLGSLGSSFDSDDDDVGKSKKTKRGVLPKAATQIMKSWLFQHIVVGGITSL